MTVSLRCIVLSLSPTLPHYLHISRYRHRDIVDGDRYLQALLQEPRHPRHITRLALHDDGIVNLQH